MILYPEQFDGLLVETESGIALGKVLGCAIETDGQMVYQYHVKPSGIAHVFAKELLIGRDSVISFSDKKMVVKDADYEARAESEITQPIKKAPLGAEPVTRSE